MAQATLRGISPHLGGGEPGDGFIGAKRFELRMKEKGKPTGRDAEPSVDRTLI